MDLRYGTLRFGLVLTGCVCGGLGLGVLLAARLAQYLDHR